MFALPSQKDRESIVHRASCRRYNASAGVDKLLAPLSYVSHWLANHFGVRDTDLIVQARCRNKYDIAILDTRRTHFALGTP